eukprot:COSAG02_NODE_14103_length_1310_cov_1.442609_2_plen_128_part_00
MGERGERGERRERREGGRKGGRRERRRKEGQTLFGEEDEERLPIQLQRPEPMAQPAILKNEAPTPAFKIMGGGIDTQRKDVRPRSRRLPRGMLFESMLHFTCNRCAAANSSPCHRATFGRRAQHLYR